MILAFGVILIAIPFILVFLYSNTFKDSIRILGYIAIFHISVAFITQLLHIFSYTFIVLLNLLFIASIVYLNNKEVFYLSLINRFKTHLLGHLKSNWFLLAVLLVIMLQLLSVRFYYTGPVQSMRGAIQVENSNYVYPYYSDEWVTASLIKYSIANKSLPTVNPLYHDQFSPNLLFIFSSTLSEFFLLTGMDPITSYFLMQMLVVFAICISFYILLLQFDVNKYISAVTPIGFLYITNSGNLPALWSLLPVTLSIVFLPWIILAVKYENKKWMMIFSLLALIVYPPNIVFILPILSVELYKMYTKKNVKASLKYILSLFGVGLGVFILLFSVALLRFNLTIGQVFTKYIIRPTLDPGIPNYFIWNILPIIVILLSIYGVYIAYKKKYTEILVPFFVGLIFWIFYSFVNVVVIIEFPRIVLITSMFFVVFSGIGLENIIRFILVKKNLHDKYKHIFPQISFGLLILCLILLPFYAKSNSWKDIKLRIHSSNGEVYFAEPANAINRYMQDDDIKLFADIKDTVIIAPAWKGLVIGATMHDFPLESKSSTISNKYYSYSKFMDLKCDEKNMIATSYAVKYVYSSGFSCPKFKDIGKSEEGYTLSTFNP